jgi:hypothetical protein
VISIVIPRNSTTHEMTASVYRRSRAKNRASLWGCRVSYGSNIIFDSQWVSLRFQSSNAAQWLANLIATTYENGCFRAPPGRRSSIEPFLEWTGDPNDDCAAETDAFYAHAEWCTGPRRGGQWYCMVSSRVNARRYFHSLDMAVEPRNGSCARWLCELVIAAAAAGLIPDYLA